MGRRILWMVIGFIAGALAVVTLHQAVIYGLSVTTTWKPQTAPWSLDPVKWTIPLWKQLEVPRLVNLMFWGGLWGAAFGFLLGNLARPLLVIMGVIFGLAGPLALGGWLLVPTIKPWIDPAFKPQALPFGYDAAGKFTYDLYRIGIGAAIQSGWGLATGIIFALFRGPAR